MDEREAMELCMELALNGWGQVHPNPMVGAVILRSGEVVATGYHAQYGGPHAEAVALASLDDASGCTCVVNLEPCNHDGKTPPCSEALIAAGITKVVYGCSDPNAKASGGAARLHEAGLEVEYQDTSGVAESLNAAFLSQQVQQELPYIALKLATSVDGYLADVKGKSKWISGPEARDFVQWLRAGFDGIGVGRRTLDADDPQLTVRGPLQPRVAPTRVVFTRTGDFSGEPGIFSSAAEIATVVVGVGDVVRKDLPPNVTFVVGDTIDAALKALRGAGCNSLLVEGGGNLAGSLLDAGVVNRLYWVQSPIFLRDGVTAFATGPGLGIDSPDQWKVVERRDLGDDTLLVLEKGICLPE